MPDLRALVISVGAGASIAAFFILVWRWSLVFGLGAGVLLGGLAFVTSVSFGTDPADADAAWRAAAPDLVDEPAGPQQTAGPQPDR